MTPSEAGQTRLLPLRLSGFYITIFFVIGCMLPFWPVWLQSRGMNGIEIGILTAIPVIAKMVFSPFFASLGDRLGERKRLMLFFLVTSLAFFAIFYWVESFAGLFIVSLLYGMSWSPLMSFGDNITLLSTRDTKIQYGRLRLWGSLSFIAMSFGFGFVLEATGDHMIFWSILVAIVLTFLATLLLPDVRVKPLGKAGRPIQTLIQDRGFQIFMVCVAMIHGSHALYYAFATIHWRTLGYSDALIGFLWAEAVMAEVVFFIFGGKVGARVAASTLLFLAAVAGILRWSVLCFDPHLYVLLFFQSFHALTFGAMHLGAMNYMNRAVSVDLSATAQSLYGASAYGLGAGVTLLFVGYFYETFGAAAFFIMTLMCIAGTICAFALRRHEKRQTPTT
ncbi:MFS transporter [Terasakiella sp. A23]|uniref:MFS transporter n=1 Tax=Terasakiella sp. FCG-A23 TaxID=3080561 RepID=UPI002955713B|nr:MFS transporter [Terasakiella sp. A23]MDV7338204.1 MFS transporter [Terasakiella sp. A23]